MNFLDILTNPSAFGYPFQSSLFSSPFSNVAVNPSILVPSSGFNSLQIIIPAAVAIIIVNANPSRKSIIIQNTGANVAQISNNNGVNTSAFEIPSNYGVLILETSSAVWCYSVLGTTIKFLESFYG